MKPTSIFPTSAEVTAIVQAYGLYINSQGTNIKTQQRLYNKLSTLIDKAKVKYPKVDFESDAFYLVLKRKANDWWNGRVVKGSGVDW